MISFIVVASGSKGNATLVYSKTTLFQIDMGVPLCDVKTALSSLGKTTKDIQAVLITHEHSDHIKTLPLLSETTPVYSSEGTLKNPSKTLVPYQEFVLGDFRIMPFSVSHDAANPIGFLIRQGDESLGYVTDTGYLSEQNLSLLKGATYYIFESNHDYRMLLHSHRPASLKHRIHSDVGHLSNSDSAFYMTELVTPDTKGIYLAHLSEECNAPELAMQTYQDAFIKKGLRTEDYPVHLTQQWASTKGGD
jgi:phosphoribosyl 1,2-cyclic phosphodiesterase